MTPALVPIDDSDAALRALRHAMKACDAIQILNVQPRADVPVVLLPITQEALDQIQIEHGRSQLVRARKLLADAEHPYREHVLIGDPAAEIVRVAKAERVDVIVMGTRGMGALGNLLLGSTATRVIQLAEVPVTLVK